MATHGFRIPKCELLRPVAAFSSDAKVKLGAGSSFGGPTHLDEVTMATMACWTWHRFNVIQCLERNLGFAEDMDFWECFQVSFSWKSLNVIRVVSLWPKVGRRKFRSQTSDNMDRWKAEQGRGREKRKIRRKKSRRERVRRRKMQLREKVGKSRSTVFSMICGSGGSKSRLAKAAGAEPCSWPDERWKIARRCGAKHICKSKCTKDLVLGALLEVGMSKKCTACGAKHISKSKCTKHSRFGPFLEVEMSKKCTPLWREAHFEVKMYKTHNVRTTFGSWDVEKVHAVVARSTFRSQNVKNTRGSDHFWRFRCRKSARRCGAKHISKSKCSKHQGFGPLLEVQMSLRFITLHYRTLHWHHTTLQYSPLH